MAKLYDEYNARCRICENLCQCRGHTVCLSCQKQELYKKVQIVKHDMETLERVALKAGLVEESMVGTLPYKTPLSYVKEVDKNYLFEKVMNRILFGFLGISLVGMSVVLFQLFM